MLEPFRETLTRCKVVLASASPRRSELLKKLNFPFSVVPSTFPEDLNKSDFNTPDEYVIATCRQKALEVWQRLLESNECPQILIGADTVVCKEGQIFEKPKDKAMAKDMLRRFNGKDHEVYTGVVIFAKNFGATAEPTPTITKQFFERTLVHFADVDEAVIDAYVETGEPMDKAGGYGIQGMGCNLIKSISGDYYNVMGLPLHKLSLHLRDVCDHITKYEG